MKYISILLLTALTLLLASCFQKPEDTENNTGAVDTPIVEEEDMDSDDTLTSSGEEDVQTPSEDDTSLEASGSVDLNEEEEEVVIEEIEAELEELFSDLLGEDEEK